MTKPVSMASTDYFCGGKLSLLILILILILISILNLDKAD